jgi:D-alanyl-D-alanine carboxypeptidase
MTIKKLHPYLVPAGVVSLLLGTIIFLYAKDKQHDNVLSELEAEKNATIETSQSRVQTLESELSAANETVARLTDEINLLKEDLDDTERDLKREKNRNEDFADQIKEISGTVGVLDKLSKTDEELLEKYSKTYFLNENFIPMKISPIPSEYVQAGKKDQYFHGDALEFLTDMLDEAKEDGIDLKVVSAYRSFDEQAQLKGQYTQIYGSGANTFSADQGYSEHQLGTTVDLTDPTTGGTYTSFAQTEAYAWLQTHAHKFGFILSYPENNGFYVYEPWHWRFVGRDLARDLKKDSVTFYDWDQRKIDEYLVNIFD